MAPKLLVLGSIFSALLCGSAYAVDPPPQDRVALTFDESRNSSPCFSGDLPLDIRLRPDGGVDQTAFAVPSRRNLVVTDVSWFFADTRNRFSNRVVTVSLYISGPNDVTFAPLQVASALLDATSRGGVSYTNVTGFVVGPGAVVCANQSAGFTQDFNVILDIIIHGFLAP